MQYLTIEKHNDLGILRINRPEALNALNTAVLQELRYFLEATALQDKYKAIILTGTGEKAFIAGADIKEMNKMNSKEIITFSQLGQNVSNILATAPYLTIAAVNGYALGAGLEMALACDFICASSQAKLGLPEVTLGLIPGFGGAQRMLRAIGMRMTKELLMSGKSINAEEAKELGLVNHVFDHENLLKKCIELANEITSKPFNAVLQGKRAINLGAEMKLESALELETNMFAACFETIERQTAMSAFLEKRKG